MNDEHSGSQSTVYVVDDDASVRRGLSNLIRSVGLRVEVFASAAEFLAAKRPDAPACLILDVRMPGLSGLDFQAELTKARNQIPIIFITGHADIPMTVKAMKGGAIDGQENPLAIARFNNLNEVSQQFVLTSHLVQPVALAVAKPVWDKLSPAQQEAMRKHARSAAEFNDKSRLKDEKELVEFFRNGGLKVTEPDIAAFKASVDKQYQEAGLAQKWQAGLLQRIQDVK